MKLVFSWDPGRLYGLSDRELCRRFSRIVSESSNAAMLDTDTYPIVAGVPRGGYVLSDADGDPDVILIGTGSEVPLVLEAQRRLEDRAIAGPVVSMPSWELFAATLREVIEASAAGSGSRLPAVHVRPAGGRLLWLVDHAAEAQLTESMR